MKLPKSLLAGLGLAFGLVSAAMGQSALRPASGGDLVGYGSIHHPAIGRQGMVVAQSRTAAAIGAEILKKGGNAVDAAVAVAFAETVTLPRAGNIGGGGYMLVHDAASGKTVAIEYYGEAPSGLADDYLLGPNGRLSEEKVMSFKGVAVPGTVAGLYEAHRRFGHLPWAKLVQPALDLARKGLVMTDDEALTLAGRQQAMAKDPGARALYFKADGSAYEAGEVFRNPDLAWTLKQIQARGADGFYDGPVAQRLVAGVRAGGGIISASDLKAYRPRVSEPVWSDYRGYRIAYMAPSSAASSVAEAMNILETQPMDRLSWGGVASLHVMAEALKIATTDRYYSGGLPQYQTPAQGMASKAFARSRAALISMDRTLDPTTLTPVDPSPFDGPDTTHFSVADAQGNVVSNTYTLSSSFGAHVVAPGTGFLLNNSMANFDWGKGRLTSPNRPQPGKRAQSTISPVIIFKDDKPWVAVGTPGGGTILSTMVQVLVNLIDYRLNLAEAIQRPRFSQGDADDPMLLEDSIPEDLVPGLQAKGHKVGRSQIIGSVQALMIGPDGKFYGAADTRRPDAGVVSVVAY